MITKEQATEKDGDFYRHRVFFHAFLNRADGKTPVQGRRNGMTKTWVRNKSRFCIPVKIGIYDHTYITEENAHEWHITQS